MYYNSIVYMKQLKVQQDFNEDKILRMNGKKLDRKNNKLKILKK